MRNVSNSNTETPRFYNLELNRKSENKLLPQNFTKKKELLWLNISEFFVANFDRFSFASLYFHLLFNINLIDIYRDKYY